MEEDDDEEQYGSDEGDYESGSQSSADGDGQDGSVSGDRDAADGQAASKRLKVPTLDEIRELRKASLSSKPDYAQFELDCLLELRSKLSGSQGLKSRLLKIKTALEAMAAHTVTTPMARAEFPDYAFHDDDSTFDFVPPTAIHVVGSLLLDTMCNTGANVDVAIEIPVRKRDKNAFAYHDRRVLFLAAIAETLRQFGTVSTAALFQRDAHKPVVELLCSGSHPVTIRFLPMFAAAGKLKTVALDLSYGLSIAEDGQFVAHLEWCHSCMQACPQLREAAVLAKLWLRHVGMGHALNGFQITMIACHVFSSGAVDGSAHAVHIFRALLHLLATHDANEPLVLVGFPTPNSALATPLEGAVQIMAGALNIAWRTHRTHWREIQSHALSWLDGGGNELIRAAMATPGPAFHLKWDLLLEVSLAELEPVMVSATTTDGYRSARDQAAERVCALLARGFGDRCECVSFECASRSDALLIGVRLNADKAYRQLEAGPPANAAEASAAFRALWGNRAELRRFKDGSIIESVVWTSENTTERWAIPSRIAAHLLSHHFGVSDVRPIATQTDLVLPNADDAFLSVLQAFGELTQQLKALKTLPLELNDVWAMDAALRGCAVAVPDVSRPLDVLLQFVNSTAWPDDLEAIRKLYHSFRLKMADEIRTARCVVQHDCLDVHFRGYVFRLHIYLAKEVMLLRNARLAAEHRLRTHARAVHSSAVGGFQMKNNSFGQTVRLCERWLHAHLLSDKMTDEFVELTVISVYTSRHPYPRAPTSSMFAFFRWLRLLASHSWRAEPLCVAINEGDTVDHGTARALMRVDRDVDPYVVSAYDMTSQWTRTGPDAVVWARVVALARAAHSMLLPDATVVFGHNYSDYHVVVRLRDAATSRAPVRVEGEVLVGFRPVARFVRDLETHFGAIALFFFDEDGGQSVGVVFRPGVVEGSANPTLLCVVPNGHDGFAFHYGQFADTVKRMGAGIVDKLEVQLPSLRGSNGAQ